MDDDKCYMIRYMGVMIMLLQVAGDIQLYHASEVAAASTVKAGTSLILTKTG